VWKERNQNIAHGSPRLQIKTWKATPARTHYPKIDHFYQLGTVYLSGFNP